MSKDKEKSIVQISKEMRDILDNIIKSFEKESDGAINITYYEASKLLASMINKSGGIKGKIRIV